MRVFAHDSGLIAHQAGGQVLRQFAPLGLLHQGRVQAVPDRMELQF
jgi:hypothetical protein